VKFLKWQRLWRKASMSWEEGQEQKEFQDEEEAVILQENF
jgi:hypothetical protein